METGLFRVKGMTCGGCVRRIENALKDVPGVTEVNIKLSTGEARIQFEEYQTNLDQLKNAVIKAGYEIDDSNSVIAAQRKGGCCCG
jgi:copper chaperone